MCVCKFTGPKQGVQRRRNFSFCWIVSLHKSFKLLYLGGL